MMSFEPWSRRTSVRRDVNSQGVVSHIGDGSDNTAMGTRRR